MGGFNSNLGSVYVEVGADLSALTKDLQGAVQDATQAGQQIGTALESGINQSAGPAAQNITEVGNAATEAAEGGLKGLGASLEEVAALFGTGLGIAEGVESLKALAEESIDAYGKIQLATVALTALTGSAETAESTLAAMKQLALGSIFSLPEMDQAAQKMAAIGVAAESIPSAMAAVVAAAEGTGNSLDAVAASLDRIYLSATIQPRTLASLGISMQDLADTMGMSASQVTAAFQAMGPQSDDALQILTATIHRRMGDAADAIVGTLPNAINQVKVQWDSLLESLGGAAAGPLTNFLTQLNQLIASITSLGEALKSVGGSGGILSIILPQFDLVTGAWSKLKDVFEGSAAAIDVATGKYPSFQAAIAALDKQIQGVTATTKDSTQAANDKAAADQASADKTAAAAQAARDALAAQQSLAQMEADLTEATKLSGEAEKSLAENRKALVIPSIWDEEAASSALVGAQAFLKQANIDEQAALQALNAERAKASPNLQTLEELEARLAVASKTSADAREEVKEKEQNLTTARGAAKTAASELAQTEQAHAAFLKATGIPAVQDYATALASVDAAKAQAATDDAALTTAQDAYNDALKGGDPSAVAAATETLRTARQQLKTDTDAVRTAEQNLKTAEEESAKQDKALLDGQTALDQAYTRFTPHLTDLGTQMGKVQDAQAKLTTAENNEKTALDALQKLKDAGIKSGPAVEDALKSEKSAHEELTAAEKDLSSAEQQLQTDWGISAQAIQFILDPLRNLTPAAQQAEAALVSMGITPQAKIQELADKAQSAYDTILQAGTSTPQEVLQAHIAALQAEIAAYTAKGTDVPAAEQLMLARLEQQEKDYVANSTQRWSDMYKQIHDTVDNLFSGLVKDLFEGGDFLKTITGAFQKIGEDMLTTVLKPFESAFEDWISTSLTKLLSGAFGGALNGLGGSLGGSLGGLLSGGTGLANLGVNIGNDTAATASGIEGLGSIANLGGTAASTAGSIGSGISSMLGSISSVLSPIGAIGSAVSAVTGVLSMFGVGNSGDQLDRLNGIDNATTYLAWVYSSGGLHEAALLTLEAINNLFQAFTTWYRDTTDGMRDDLDGIQNRLQVYAETTFPNFAKALLAGGLIVSGANAAPAAPAPTAPDVTAPASAPATAALPSAVQDLTKQGQVLEKTLVGLKDYLSQDSAKLSSHLAQKTTTEDLIGTLQKKFEDLNAELSGTTDPAQQKEITDQIAIVQQNLIQAKSDLNDVQKAIQVDLAGQQSVSAQIATTQKQIADVVAQINGTASPEAPTSTTTPVTAPAQTAPTLSDTAIHDLTTKQDLLGKTLVQLKDSLSKDSEKLSSDLAAKATDTDLVATLEKKFSDLNTELSTTTDPAQRQEITNQIAIVQGELIKAKSDLNDVQKAIQVDLAGQQSVSQQIATTQKQIADVVAQLTHAASSGTTPLKGAFTFPGFADAFPIGSVIPNAPPPSAPQMKPDTRDLSSTISSAIRTGMTGARITIDGRELIGSSVQFFEDNGLVVPQS